jgi:hypothetical protein
MSEALIKSAQADEILACLATGKTLTAQDAIRKFRCYRLAARIYDLRERGHDIATVWERAGDKRWARYVLVSHSLQVRA